MIYVALLRGINVGGNNKVSMAELKANLEELGYWNVKTYINSGNIVFESGDSASETAQKIEADLLKKFPRTTMPIKTLVLSRDQLAGVIKSAPKGFGHHPEKYYSDAIFLIGVNAKDIFPEFDINPAVDKAWPGDGVVYFRRLSARRTSSRLGRVISKPIYKSMTIRSWSTVQKLLSLMDDVGQK